MKRKEVFDSHENAEKTAGKGEMTLFEERGKRLDGLVKLARNALKSGIRPMAAEVARLLDECGSENEFRLKCAAEGVDPEDKFRPYAQYVAFARGYDLLGLRADKLRLRDWWAFERIKGANKPDPFLRGYADHLL